MGDMKTHIMLELCQQHRYFKPSAITWTNYECAWEHKSTATCSIMDCREPSRYYIHFSLEGTLNGMVGPTCDEHNEFECEKCK